VSFLSSTLPDLIRHGKHHRHSRDGDDPISPSSPIGFHQQQQQAQQQAKKQLPPITEHIISPPTREVAEIIVNQEREEKLKMPVYAGLEDFKITNKMGECVCQPPDSDEFNLSPPFRSEELSPMYTTRPMEGQVAALLVCTMHRF